MADLPELLLQVLHARGITGDALEDYLDPSLRRLGDPSELPGVDEAASLILDMARERRPLVVFGDYDCDGVCATALLVKTLKALFPDAPVRAFLPERVPEGYGMSDKSVERLLAENPDLQLLVTVDNGINSVKHVAALRAKGVRVVVTDHHLPGAALPDADALVNPKVAAPQIFESLCGAGVAFFLAQRLVTFAKAQGLYKGPSLAGEPLVLAALATVTDVMPLLGQNRILLACALERFHALAPIGLRELYARAARQGATRLSTRDFSFLLGPRINAAGRMASGREALDLLLEDDRERVREKARRVDMRNDARKASEQEMAQEALKKIVPGAAAQVIDLPDGNPGVAGIVATRLLEAAGGSGMVCVIAGGHGSARASEGLNVREAFEACREHLLTFGGHAAAGGFAVKPGAVDDFRNALCRHVEAQKRLGVLAPATDEPEAWIRREDLTLDLAHAILRLAPFGEANEEPLFGLRNVRLFEMHTFSEGKNLSFFIEAPGRGEKTRGVWWGHGSEAESCRKQPCDLLFNIRLSTFDGERVELHVVEVR